MKPSTYNQISAAITGFVMGLLFVLVSFVAVSCAEPLPDKPLTSSEMFEAIKTCNRRGHSVRFEHDANGAPVSWWCSPPLPRIHDQ